MYEEMYKAVMVLLKESFIQSITFTRTGKIKVKFTFTQNKVRFDTIMDLLEKIDNLNGEPIEE